MNASESEQFAEIMYGLADNFGVELSKPGLRMRFEALKAFSIGEIRDAAMKILFARKYKSMPTIAEFLDHLRPPKIESKDRALIEADKIISHLRLFGATKFPQIEDEITRHLMRHRWPYHSWARHVAESELKWWVREFCEIYNSYAAAGGAPLSIEASNPIAGLIENIGGVP